MYLILTTLQTKINMVLFFIIITLCYLLLIGSLAFGFDKVPHFILKDIAPKNKFSVIIPFRNEAENLQELLQSLSLLNYSKNKFEVLMVNDASEDDSVAIINQFISENSDLGLKILQNKRISKSPKKDAIKTAILQAKHSWVITTDADCIVPKYWLDSFDAFIQEHNSHCIVAPVTYNKTDSFLERFQLLDFLSLIGATIGGFGIKKPFLCNGANFAYTKEFFNTVNGFEGNNKIASGDDIFLLEKAIKHNKNTVHFLKNQHAIVTTKPQSSFKNLLAQRKRWAAKTSNYSSVFGKLTGLLVLTMNTILICGLAFVILGILNLKIFIYLFILKALIDFLLLYKTSRFFNQEQYLKSFLISSILYPFFNVFIAFTSLFTGYKWKNRHFTK